MRAFLLLGALGLLAGPCTPRPPEAQLPELDYPSYVALVEPELLGSCAFSN